MLASKEVFKVLGFQQACKKHLTSSDLMSHIPPISERVVGIGIVLSVFNKCPPLIFRLKMTLVETKLRRRKFVYQTREKMRKHNKPAFGL